MKLTCFNLMINSMASTHVSLLTSLPKELRQIIKMHLLYNEISIEYRSYGQWRLIIRDQAFDLGFISTDKLEFMLTSIRQHKLYKESSRLNGPYPNLLSPVNRVIFDYQDNKFVISVLAFTSLDDVLHSYNERFPKDFGSLIASKQKVEQCLKLEEDESEILILKLINLLEQERNLAHYKSSVLDSIEVKVLEFDI